MSVIVLPTTSTSTMDRLTPSWIRRSRSPRDKSPQATISRPNSSNGPLSPRATDSTTTTNESQSSQPNTTSSRRASIRGVVHRLRSSSSASLIQTGVQEVPTGDIHDWFRGFQRYNALVTTGASQQEFAKACKTLSKNCGGDLVHSLPEATFDLALLWCPVAKPSQTTTSNTKPSWSWTSSTISVNFPLDPTTSPDLFRLPKDTGALFRSEITQFHVGPFPSPYTLRREKNPALRIQYPPYFHAPRGSDPTKDSSTLRFTTTAISAESYSAEQLHHRDAEIPCSQLLNAAHQHCGLILDYESSFSEPCDQGPFEFILLSRTRRVEPNANARRPRDVVMHPPGVPIWDGERFLWDEEVVEVDDSVFSVGEWSMLNVMLVRWVGDYAVRVAIVRMHEDEWASRAPVRREVVLR